jgi:hypothetical protein
MPSIRVLLVWFVFAGLARAEDWPQWLGPRRDGSSTEKVAPWKGDLKVLWRKSVGDAHSSPIVANGKVYLHFKVKDKDEEQLTCWDATSGKEEWSKSYPRAPFFSIFGLGPAATPTAVNGKVYTYGVTGVLTCWDAARGDQVWQVDALKTLGGSNLFFGVSASPLVEGDKVVVQVGAKGASIVAFDRNKGDVAWKSLDDKASYSSPIAVTLDGDPTKTRQVLCLTQAGLRSLDPEKGTLLWETPFVDRLNESSTTPVVVDGKVLVSSVTIGSKLVRPARGDGKWTVEEEWKNRELNCYFSTPVPVGKDHLYLVTGGMTKVPSSTLRCVETKSGKVLWNKEKVATFHAALLRTADDKLLMLDDGGNLKLLEPDPVKYQELATARVCGKTWAHPVLSNGKLYVRDEKELLCIELTDK